MTQSRIPVEPGAKGQRVYLADETRNKIAILGAPKRLPVSAYLRLAARILAEKGSVTNSEILAMADRIGEPAPKSPGRPRKPRK